MPIRYDYKFLRKGDKSFFMSGVLTIIDGVKPEEDKTRNLKDEYPVNKEYRFGYVTFKELEEAERHPPDVQRAIRFLRDRLGNCPDITPDFPCFFYIMNREDQIVCSVKAFPDTLWVGSKKYPWAWMGALFTKEGYRGKGLAAKITEESRRILHKQGICRGSVFSTEITLHIHKKFDFSFPGYVNRYLMIKSAKPFMEAHIKSKWVVHILDVLSRKVIELIYRYYFGKKNRGVLKDRFVNLNYADPSRLSLPELYYEAKYHFNDRLEKLLWKVKGSNAKPENDCSLYLLEDIENGTPFCYFVLRLKMQSEPLANKYKDFKLMTLMDFGLYKNDERIQPTLLREVIDLFWKSDAEVLEVLSNSKTLTGLMKQKGLIKVGKGMSFTFSVPENLNFDKESNNLRSWHLTSFCGDAFSF